MFDLNKKVEDLKKIVFEQTKIPAERQVFYFDNQVIDNNWLFTEDNKNIFKKKINIKIQNN